MNNNFPFELNVPLFLYDIVSDGIFKISIHSIISDKNSTKIAIEVLKKINTSKDIFSCDYINVDNKKLNLLFASDLGINGFKYDNRPCYIDENLDSLKDRIQYIKNYIEHQNRKTKIWK